MLPVGVCVVWGGPTSHQLDLGLKPQESSGIVPMKEQSSQYVS